MKAILNKVRSNHSNIGDRYEGVVGTLPKPGDSFVLYLDEKHKAEGTHLQTTPVTMVSRLSKNVIEFETKNSKYSLELQDDKA